MNKKVKYCLSTLPDKKKGGLIAVISIGSPQLGDKEVVVCSVNRCKDQEEAELWFIEELEEKPWEREQQ